MAFGVELQSKGGEGVRMPPVRLGPIERADLSTLPEFNESLAEFLKLPFADQLRDLAAGGSYFDYLNDGQDNLHWGIFNTHNKLIGLTGFRNMHSETPPIMRISLFDPSCKGMGYGNSATFVRTFAIHTIYKFTSNVATIHSGNTPSMRAAVRFGYMVTDYIEEGGHGRYELAQYHPNIEFADESAEHILARSRVMGALSVGEVNIQINP